MTELATNPTVIDGRIEHTGGYTVYPRGAGSLNDPNISSFAVQIIWRGEYRARSGGGWSVTHRSSELLVSSVSAGKPHLWGYPDRFRRWQYRFKTFEDALAAARAVVDHVQVNGGTWQWWHGGTGKPQSS